jgi:hypothetical protein
MLFSSVKMPNGWRIAKGPERARALKAAKIFGEVNEASQSYAVSFGANAGLVLPQK